MDINLCEDSLSGGILEEKILNVGDCKCHALIYKAQGTPIVFFHGLSYNADVWQRIGITEHLEKKKVPFLALDMPYGIKSNCQPKTRDPKTNVDFAYEAINAIFNGPPIIVGASIGGYIALNYAREHPTKGMFLVAPAHAFDNDDLVLDYPKFKIPIRIVWGTSDRIISGEEMRTLTDTLPNAKMLVYADADHSAYKDRPERFKQDLLELYATAEE